MVQIGIFLAMLFLGSVAFTQNQAPADDLTQRVEKLEQALSEIASKTYSRQGMTQAFLAESLNIGGFFENSLTTIWGPDSPSQTVADSHRLGLNLSAEIKPRLRLVTQFSLGFNYVFRNEHNNPDHGSSFVPLTRSYQEVSFGSLLSQAFGEYELSSNHRVEAGLGFVPFGRAYQVRDPVLFLKRRGPQMIRTSGINRLVIADPFWKGFHLLGNLMDNQFLTYNLYTNSPLAHSGKLGVGGRLAGQIGSAFEWGASFQQGYQEGEAYLSTGGDLKWGGDRWGTVLEGAQFQTNMSKNESFYIQFYWLMSDPAVTLFLDLDYLKNPYGQTLLGTSSVNDPYIKYEQAVGMNYNFSANAKLRLEIVQHDYVGDRAVVSGQNRDYYSGSISSGISF